MTIIAISGSVGSGKTTISEEISKKLNGNIIHLNERAKEFKIEDDNESQTFDFDIDKLVANVNQELSQFSSKDNVIVEGHFAHFLNPQIIDYLFVITRDLKDLQKEYQSRKYNEQKIKDNLEVESFNLCFYEGVEEGFEEEKQIFAVENNGSLNEILDKILNKINENN